MVKASGLRGRGGAGFPTGLKWTFLPKDHPGPIYMCINADESEPGTFNNRILMEDDPHQVLEGHHPQLLRHPGHDGLLLHALRIPARAASGCRRPSTSATRPAISARTSSAASSRSTSTCTAARRRTSAAKRPGLIESLEGKRAWPRIKPPFPAVEGAFRKPTVVNNIETVACVTHIVDRGVDWFKSIGVPPDPNNPRDAGSYGPKLYCLSGHVNKPGCYEAPLGITCRRADRRIRRRRLERPQGEGGHSRRHQHGPADRGGVRHAARFQRRRARSAAWAWARRPSS